VVNGEMSLRRLKLSIHEVVTPREEEEEIWMGGLAPFVPDLGEK
jgi:hypothetical protein